MLKIKKQLIDPNHPNTYKLLWEVKTGVLKRPKRWVKSLSEVSFDSMGRPIERSLKREVENAQIYKHNSTKASD
jgi:hypothetical protein